MKPRPTSTGWRVTVGDLSGGCSRLNIGRLLAVDRTAAIRGAFIGAFLVVLVGLPLAAVLNIWIDEAFTLRTTGGGPLEAWRQAVGFEVQPPLYFVLESVWRLVNERSIFVARIPSVVFASAAVALIVGAAHRLVPRTPPLIVALVTALNPLVIWAAVEMRVYPLVLLIAAALSWAFLESFLVEKPSRRARIVYALLAICGLFTQYYFGFLLVAHGLTVLVMRRRAIWAFGATMAAAAVAFAPFAPIAISHVEASGAFVARVTLAKAAHEIFNAVFAFVLPHDVNWFGPEKIGGFLLAAALVIGLLAFGRPALPGQQARAFVLQWLICLVIFALLFTASGVPLDPLRHLTILGPSSLLFATLLVSSTTRRRRPLISAALGVFACFAGVTLWVLYRPPTVKSGDWERVAALLAAQRGSTPVAVFPAELALPLHAYFATPTIPIPKPMPFAVDYVRQTTLTSNADVARVLDPIAATSDELWLVTSGSCGEAKLEYYDYNCRYLEAYVNRRYHVVKAIAFRGSLARLYRRSADAANPQ